MQKILVVLSLLVLAGCNSMKTGTSKAEKYILESIAEMSLDQIHKTYPDANAQEGVDLFEEGTTERPYTILYPNTPAQLHITWKDENRTKVYSLKASEGEKWQSKTGIKIGTTLEQLNKINGKSVKIYGFGWDYSGAVDWNGGRLDKEELGVFLTSDEDIPTEFYGDKIIEASLEELKKIDLKVGSIMILKSK